MKRLIIFMAIFFGLSAITLAQSTEKIKTKIEQDGFKTKTKKDVESHHMLTSSASHPAYVHHGAIHHRTVHHYVAGNRHLKHRTMHVAHTKAASHSHAAHYKKMKRTHKNGEYKVKYKT